MKIFFSILVTSLQFSTVIHAQSVGINNNAPHASAILDVQSTTKGFLMPRMTTAQRNAIASPAAGLKVYDTDTNIFWFYNGTAWLPIATGNNGWNLTGNTGTNPTTHFIGTTDEQPLRFRVNNLWAGELHPTSGNIFLGVGSGQSNTSGMDNTAVGKESLFSNAAGSRNVAYGNQALYSNTLGSSNTALGNLALFSNNSGGQNSAIGYAALYSNTIGYNNTANGALALFSNINGGNNTATGNFALYSNTAGNDNTATGYATLANNTGNNNTATGKGALSDNTTGSNNNAHGYQALNKNTLGNFNTANGTDALYSNIAGEKNTANGYQALYLNTGSDNTATGYQALYSNVGFENIATGNQALYSNTIGFRNVANGSQALYWNIQGESNTASGYRALYFNDRGSNNTGVGDGALYRNYFGSNNTAVGFDALVRNINGSKNIAIGFQSGTSITSDNLSNTISIGNDGSFLNAASNQAIIGNSSTVFIGGKVNWGIVSDERIKRNIKEDVKGLDFIMKLRPVTYNISNAAISEVRKIVDTVNFTGKYDGEKITYSGFLAQEVEQAAITTGYNFSGYTKPVTTDQLYTIRYAEFVVPLVKAMQEQQQIIDLLQKQVEAAKAEIPMQIGKQQAIITNQQKQIDLLEKKLATLEIKK